MLEKRGKHFSLQTWAGYIIKNNGQTTLKNKNCRSVLNMTRRLQSPNLLRPLQLQPGITVPGICEISEVITRPYHI